MPFICWEAPALRFFFSAPYFFAKNVEILGFSLISRIEKLSAPWNNYLG